MSDLERRLRELRAAKSNAVEDDVPAIRERMRTGQVDEAGLRVAALLGSVGARELLGAAAPSSSRDTPTWLEALAKVAAPAATIRLAVAGARLALPLWERRPARCDRHGSIACEEALCQVDPRVRAALERLEACLAAPTPSAVSGLLESQAAAGHAIADLHAARPEQHTDRRSLSREEAEDHQSHGEEDQKEPIAKAVRRATLAAIALHGDGANRGEAYRLLSGLPQHVSCITVYVRVGEQSVARPLPADDSGWAEAWQRAAHEVGALAAVEVVGPIRAFARDDAVARRLDAGYLLGERFEELRAALRADVLPWVLGRADPLAARVAARAR